MTQETLDILQKVNEFYDSAWNKLIIATTVIFGLVGVIIPIIIQWIQNKTFQNQRELLRREMEDEFQKKLKKSIKKNTERINRKVSKSYYRLEGMGYHLQGKSHCETQRPAKGILDFLNASKFYLAGKEYNNLLIVLENVLKALKDTDKEKLDKQIKSVNWDLNDYYEFMNKNDKKSIATNIVMKIKEHIEELK